MGKLMQVTYYAVGFYRKAPYDNDVHYIGSVFRDTRIPCWKMYPSDSYRVWNYIWGEDPDA